MNDATLVTRAPDDRSKAGAPVERIERRTKRVLVGRDAKMIAIVDRLAPVAYPAILERLRGRT